jgi:hypothetical protein
MRATVTAVLLLGALGTRPGLADDAAPAPEAPAATEVPEVTEASGPEDTFRITLGFVGGYGFALPTDLAAGDLPAGLDLKEPADLSLAAPAVDGLGYLAFSVRAYLPWFVAAELGIGAVYAHSITAVATAGGLDTVARESLALELPLLAGVYYPLFGQLFLAALAGPVLLSGTVDLADGAGALGDALADPLVGFAAVASLEWIPFELLAVGLELRYRYLVGAELQYGLDDLPAGAGYEVERFEADDTVRTYPLDLSGLAVQLSLRLVL